MLTVAAYAARVGLSVQRVRAMIAADRLRPRPKRLGNVWVLSDHTTAKDAARGPQSKAIATHQPTNGRCNTVSDPL